MRVTFTYGVEVADDADVVAIQGAGEAAVAEHGNVFHSAQASMDETFTVVGVVKGRPTEQWSEVVQAQDAAEAEQKAMAAAPEGTEYSVAAVIPGEVTVADATA